jgi:DnaK suppressor protein
MKEYSTEFLKNQRQELERMSEELRNALELETERFNELMQDLAIKDRPEVGTERIDNRRLGMIETVDRERMRRISSALYRLDHGDYGFCEICGAPIGEERLEAKPDALLCIDCKERREAEGAGETAL